MKTASEYRQYAAECRTIAASLPLGEARDQLLRMAGKWEELATARGVSETAPDGAALDGTTTP